MRTFYRLLAIFAVAFGLCLGLAPLAPAQADVSAACQSYQYLRDQPLEYLSSSTTFAWGLQMAADQCTIDAAAADIPVRQFTGEQRYAPRPGRPCEKVALKQQNKQLVSDRLEAECVADWVDYVIFLRTRADPRACFDIHQKDETKETNNECRPDQSAAAAKKSDDGTSLAGGIELLGAIALVFCLWRFARGPLSEGYMRNRS